MDFSTPELRSFVYFSLAAALIGFSIALIFQPIDTPNRLLRAAGVAFLSAFIGVVIRWNYLVYEDVSSLYDTVRLIASDCPKPSARFPDPIWDAIALDFSNSAHEKCTQLNTGSVELTPEQVKTVWTIMAQTANDTFFATNTIAPDDWPERSCRVQRDSRVKQIKRIMILRHDEPEFNAKLDNLAMRQIKECGVRNVYKYYKDTLYSYFAPEISALGEIDIVLVDDKVLLLTTYDEQTKFIRRGVVTTNPTKINVAHQLFVGPFSSSDEYR